MILKSCLIVTLYRNGFHCGDGFGDGLTHFNASHELATITVDLDVGRSESVFQNLLDGLLQDFGLLGTVQIVLQHHGSTQDHGQWVRLVFPGNVGRRSVAGFEDTGSGFSNGRRGEHTERSNQHGGFVTKNISENIAGDNGVELFGPSDELHGGVVDVHMAELDVGKVLGDDIGNDFSPQLAHVQDVGLIDTAQFTGTLAGDVTGNTGNAIDFGFLVNHVVVSDAFAVDFVDSLRSSKVDIARQFTNDHDVDALDDFPLEGGGIDQLRQDLGRSQVGKESHGGSHLQEATLGAQFSRIVVPLVSTNAGQQDGIRGLALGQGFRGEGIVDGVDGGSTNQSFFELERKSLLLAEGFKDALGGDRNLGSNTVSRQ
mmetsp:Transcript_2380/g.5147  ORF Transcript_2380/g.5147 Transcript_2380/m.5147 type:complete len:372 (+) Transcript_2380:11-1126(+)